MFLTLLPALSIPFSSWVALPSPDMRVCAWSDCNLFCQVCLISPGGLLSLFFFFFGGKWRKSGYGGKGKRGI